MIYSTYPFKFMNITQRHDEGNHKAHNYPFIDCSDKPWDEACKDSGRSAFIPFTNMKVKKIFGKGNTVYTNSVILETIKAVKIPYRKEPCKLYITLTHMLESDLKKINEGDIIYEGQELLYEGTDGVASGNHFHITANIGKYYGFKKNANGKWCYVFERSLLPNEAFYIDFNKTKIINSNHYTFTKVPKEDTFLPPRGYFKFGDKSENISKISDFMYKNFPSYTSSKARGEYFGKYLLESIVEFQKRTGLVPDGNIGKLTLNMLVKYGFTY